MWECYLCEKWSCGDHEFRIDRNHNKICLICESPDTYEQPSSAKIPALPLDKSLAFLHYTLKKDQAWRDAHPEEVAALESPEY